MRQLLLLSIFLPLQIFAQYWSPEKYMKVKGDGAKRALNYRAEYPNDPVIMTDGIETYDFFVTKDNTGKLKVASTSYADENYLALQEYANLVPVEGYNEFIKIAKFSAKASKGKFKWANPIYDREYKSEEFFDHDQRIMYAKIPLSTTGVTVNTDIKKVYTDVRYLSKIYLVGKYSEVSRKIVFNIPDWLEVDIKEFNFKGHTINKETVTKTGFTQITYTIENAKAVSEEPLMADFSISTPHLIFIPKSFKQNNEEIRIFSDAGDLYKWYSEIVKDVDNKKDSLKPIVQKLIQGKSTDEEKVKSIYYWVQDNIKYIAFERGIAGFRPEAAFTTYKNKFGDCKAMANLLANMLQVAGFDARLAWIGTNDIPYDYSIPSLCVDNHMICALKLKDKFYFLDGTEKFISLNDNGQRIQGKQTLVQDGEKHLIETVPSHPLERNKQSYAATFDVANGMLRGNHTEVYRGESQVRFFNIYHNLGESDKDKLLIRILARYDKDYDISNITHSDLNNREMPIELTYRSEIANKIINNGNSILVSIDNEASFESMIPEKDRKNPVYIDDRISLDYDITLNIPAGYSVKELPKPFMVKADNYNFEISYTEVGGKVVMKKKVTIDKLIVPMDKMDQWRNDVKALSQNSNAFVVLSK